MSGTAYTPPSVAFASGTLSDQERGDVRRFCGYPAYGSGAQGFQSHRFFQWYGVLEFRLSNLAPAELQFIRMLMSNMATVEQGIFCTYENLDTDETPAWKHNKNESVDRWSDFNRQRRHLCGFLGVPEGDALKAQPGSPSAGRIAV